MLSEQTKQIIDQAQIYQQQIQNVLIQKEVLNSQLNEIKTAVKEITKSKEDKIYKIAGPVLIKVNKTEIKKELAEKEELINLRIKTLEKSENKIKEKIDELRQKLSKISSSKNN